jgi:hypothetical protein
MRHLLIGLFLALLGCQTAPPVDIADISATEGNDLTLGMNGCEGSLSRGVEVCRFVLGAPITETLRVFVPWFIGLSTRAHIRIRAGAVVSEFDAFEPSLKIPYAKLFRATTWSQDHDMPVQVLVTTYNHDGIVKSLGYVYIIILRQGYNPRPMLSPGAPKSSKLCRIDYDAKGRSVIWCGD